MFFRWSLISVCWELPDGYWQHTSKQKRERDEWREGWTEREITVDYHCGGLWASRTGIWFAIAPASVEIINCQTVQNLSLNSRQILTT